MDEEKIRPIRPVSGRLSDTTEAEEPVQTREVFTPRRPDRTRITDIQSKVDQKRNEPKRAETDRMESKRPEQKVIRPEERVRKAEERAIHPRMQETAERAIHPRMQETAERAIHPRVQEMAEGSCLPEGQKKRRRIQESERRMRTLWSALGILTVLLIAAILYEIVLGHGLRQTGSQRMEQQRQERMDTADNMEDIIVILDETEPMQEEDRREDTVQTEAEAVKAAEGL